MGPSDDFYEDDEPVEQVVQAFEQGEKQLTAPPRGVTQTLEVGVMVAGSGSRGQTESLDVHGATLTLISAKPATATSQMVVNGLAA